VKIYRKIPVAAGLVLSQVAIAASVKSASRRRPNDMRIIANMSAVSRATPANPGGASDFGFAVDLAKQLPAVPSAEVQGSAHSAYQRV
jgi:hypothetical protein